MKVAILGNEGMLGHMVEHYFKKNGQFQFVNTEGHGRRSLNVSPKSLNQLGTKLSYLFGFNTDYIINCIGAIKPVFDDPLRVPEAIYTNSVFPRQLATWGQLTNTKILHITTDCVYDGWIGKYKESYPHSAHDLYGMSKSLGEPHNCMTIRTSIIGPELRGKDKSLMSWLKKQDGGQKRGFTNHLWNGLTTLELARVLFDITTQDLYEETVFHVFSTDINKYELVTEIVKEYNLEIDIEEFEHPDGKIDRTLRTEKGLNDLVIPQDISGMIEELRDHEERHKLLYGM